jgi:hypothetical protein
MHDEIGAIVREPRRAAVGTPVADTVCMSQPKHSIFTSVFTALPEHEENTMITRGDWFETIEELAAVRGGQCDGPCCLDTFYEGASAGAAAGMRPIPPQPSRSRRDAWPRGLEADF